MDEVKRIIREIADTQVEIRVCERLKSKGVLTRGSKPVSELLAICERKLITLHEQLTILKKPAASAAAPQASQSKKLIKTTAAAPSAGTKKLAEVAAPAAAQAKEVKKSPLVDAVPQPAEIKKVAAVVATIAPQPLHQKRPALVVTTAPPINQKRPVLVVTASARATAVGARAIAQANNLKKPALVSAALVPPRPVRR